MKAAIAVLGLLGVTQQTKIRTHDPVAEATAEVVAPEDAFDAIDGEEVEEGAADDGAEDVDAIEASTAEPLAETLEANGGASQCRQAILKKLSRRHLGLLGPKACTVCGAAPGVCGCACARSRSYSRGKRYGSSSDKSSRGRGLYYRDQDSSSVQEYDCYERDSSKGSSRGRSPGYDWGIYRGRSGSKGSSGGSWKSYKSGSGSSDYDLDYDYGYNKPTCRYNNYPTTYNKYNKYASPYSKYSKYTPSRYGYGKKVCGWDSNGNWSCKYGNCGSPYCSTCGYSKYGSKPAYGYGYNKYNKASKYGGYGGYGKQVCGYGGYGKVCGYDSNGNWSCKTGTCGSPYCNTCGGYGAVGKYGGYGGYGKYGYGKYGYGKKYGKYGKKGGKKCYKALKKARKYQRKAHKYCYKGCACNACNLARRGGYGYI